jgi:hypothetical protein
LKFIIELLFATDASVSPCCKVEPMVETAIQLRADMSGGKASYAKAADGDQPVFAYIASLPQPQREIAERVDALAAATLPGLRRAVKWGMAYYGVEGGWCFTSGAFVGHVKVMFIRGIDLEPEPPVKPIAMGKATRGVEIASVDEGGRGPARIVVPTGRLDAVRDGRAASRSRLRLGRCSRRRRPRSPTSSSSLIRPDRRPGTSTSSAPRSTANMARR